MDLLPEIYKKAAKPEQAAQDRVRKILTEMGCLVEKNHGSLYTSGRPDLIVHRPDGLSIYIEMKWTDRKAMKYVDIFGLLSPVQKGFLLRLRKKTRTPALIAVGGIYGYMVCGFPPVNPENHAQWVPLEQLARMVFQFNSI